MTYKEICKSMNQAGWDAHFALCLKHINGPHFDRSRQKFCTVGNIKQLDTYMLYEQMGRAPDLDKEAGEPVEFPVYEPASKGSTQKYHLKGWIHKNEGILAFLNPGD